MEPSASSSHHPLPLLFSMTSKSSLFLGRLFPGVDIMARKGASLGRVLTEQQPLDLPMSFPISILGSSGASGQVLNNTHDLRHDH